MAVGWGTKFVKYSLIGFNLIFFISGIILISVGATVKTVYSDYTSFLDDKYFSLPNLLIATGCMIFFISFFGCYGALKESWVLLYGFIGFLILIFIMEFSAGIAGYVLRDKTTEFLRNKLQVAMMQYGDNKTILSEGMWDLIQKDFKCCGLEKGPADWAERFTNHSLPFSCCQPPVGAVGLLDCRSDFQEQARVAALVREDVVALETMALEKDSPVIKDDGPPPDKQNTTETSSSTSVATTTNPATSTNATTTTNADKTTDALSSNDQTNNTTVSPPYIIHGKPYTEGCVDAFGTFIQSHAVSLGGAGFAIACMQLLGILFACHLARQIKIGYFST